VKDGEPVDWRYHLGEDVYVIIKAPQLTIHTRKYFVPNGDLTLHPTKRGVSLSLYEWKELKRPYLYLKTESYRFSKISNPLLMPFHSVSSAYLPPPRGTLTGMFNAWVWSLATAKAINKAPQLTIQIKKYFVPNGEWTVHPTKRGVTLSLYEWKELKKTIPLFEDSEQ
jgi:hypothetical protein